MFCEGKHDRNGGGPKESFCLFPGKLWEAITPDAEQHQISSKQPRLEGGGLRCVGGYFAVCVCVGVREQKHFLLYKSPFA